jgi:acyl-ACP thioesterase
MATQRLRPRPCDRGTFQISVLARPTLTEAFGRFLQDVAADDARDSGLSELGGVWVVRRYDLVFTGFPSFRDILTL